MKKIVIILSVILSILVFSIFLNFQTTSLKAQTKVLQAPQVIVYYFHNNVRCPNCHKIENYTRETLNQCLSKELKNGTIEFKVINFDEKPNKHYIKDYQLYTKSVVISKIKDGKELKWKNLDKIWFFLGDKDKYQEYLKKEIRAFLKGK